MPGPASGRKVRDSEEARELLRAWARSGQRMSEWCSERGINWYSLSAFRGWRDREEDANPGFVEVVTTALTTRAAATTRGIHRVIVGDYTVEVAGDFEDDTLRRLLRVVASC